MKKNGLKYFLVIAAIAGLASCKKVIDLHLGNASGQLVIEGNMTNVPGPQYVMLSRNVPFTSPNVYPAVSGAAVSIADDRGNQYPMTEGSAGTYSVPNAFGFGSRTYTLTVNAGGKTYTATSTMPGTVNLDSITDKPSYFDAKSGQKIITVHFQDPANIPNQYRFVMHVNRVQVNSIFAFNDEFIDGKHVDLDLQENDIKIYPKDTVTVEMQCIDKPIYTYWYSLAQEQVNNPGGQVAPSNPPTNITPTTLGYFSAHTTQTLTLVVK
ncbi:MAG: DUF4249 domain-containing protein [Bacteroidetes bacterium]|nr:DUF4249 domain-containing protein [Bacteroidota bacterium]